MLTRIRNATLARQPRVEMPSSRLKVEIARILESEGYSMASGAGAGAEEDKAASVFLKEAARERGYRETGQQTRPLVTSGVRGARLRGRHSILTTRAA